MELATTRCRMPFSNVEMPDYVTVTVNDEFVDNSQRAETILRDGDQVEFLYFMGGGR